MELSNKQSSNGRVDINGPKTSDLFQDEIGFVLILTRYCLKQQT